MNSQFKQVLLTKLHSKIFNRNFHYKYISSSKYLSWPNDDYFLIQAQPLVHWRHFFDFVLEFITDVWLKWFLYHFWEHHLPGPFYVLPNSAPVSPNPTASRTVIVLLSKSLVFVLPWPWHPVFNWSSRPKKLFPIHQNIDWQN